jgi:ferritin
MELPNSTITNVTTTQSSVLLPKTLPQELVTHINSALGEEYAAHYFYRNAANYCDGLGYTNAGEFFKKEAESELEHAGKLQKYLVDWNCAPVIPPIKFTGQFDNLIDVVNKAYAMEYGLGDKYNEISAKIFVQHLPTFDFLQEFRTLQVQAIAEYSDLLNGAQLVDVSNKLDIFHYEERYFG